MVRLGNPQQGPSSLPRAGGADWAGASGPFDSRAPAPGPAVIAGRAPCARIGAMELTWYGRTCIRLRGKDAVVVNAPYPAVVGPTGRGITGAVVTFRHPADAPLPKKAVKLSRDGATAIPSSLEPAFVLDGPGEYEVHDVLLTGVRTYRDDGRGTERGRQGRVVTVR